jgi:hypothetical protein
MQLDQKTQYKRRYKYCSRSEEQAGMAGKAYIKRHLIVGTMINQGGFFVFWSFS